MRPTVFHGHSGYFKQNLSDYPLGDGGFDWWGMGFGLIDLLNQIDQKPGKVRFMTLDARPYVHAKRDKLGFSVAGPIFSLVYEVARFLNYSLDGICIDKEDRNVALFKYAPDIAALPLYPQTEYAQWIMDYIPTVEIFIGVQFAKFSRAVDFLTCDCIGFRKEFVGKNLFAFFDVFDIYTILGVVLSCLLIPLSLAITTQKFNQYLLWVVKCFEAILNEEHLNSKRKLIGWLLSFWVLLIWILKQFFSGDMFSHLTATPHPKVIDSWSDLNASLNSIPDLEILALDLSIFENAGADSAVKSYFNPVSQYYDDFTNRLTLIKMYDISRETGVVTIRRSIKLDETIINSKGNIRTYREELEWFDAIKFNSSKVIMLECLALRHNIREMLERRHTEGVENVHISEYGGETAPYFFPTTMMAEKIESQTLNKFITRLSESGIYQKWVLTAVYGFKEIKEKSPLVSYRAAQFSNFFGPIIICYCFIIFAAISFVIEKMVFLYFWSRVSRRRVFICRKAPDIVLKPRLTTSKQSTDLISHK